MRWPKAGGSLHNTNFQAMGGDYSGGFVEIYRTDCTPLSPSISSTSTYTQFAIDDIDGDGNNEVVAHAYDHVCAFDGATGTPLWFHPIDAGHDATPLLEDVDNDGLMEVVILNRTRSVLGSVVIKALNGADGTVEWSYTLSSYSLSTSSPTAYDIDGDGDRDVLVGADDDTLYVLDGSTGTPLWKFGLDGDLRVTPAVTSTHIVVVSFSGTVYALDFTGSLLWSSTLPGNVWASPVIADVDGIGLNDVVVATLSGDVVALNGDDGSELWPRRSMPGGVRTTPIVADMDRDGIGEVVVGDIRGNLRVFNLATGTVEHAFSTSPVTGINPYWAMLTADIYPSSPGLEILITTDADFRSSPNRTFVYSYDGTLLFYANNTGDGSAIADVDNDGCMEFVTENEGGFVPRGEKYSVYDSPTNVDSACVVSYDDPISVDESSRGKNEPMIHGKVYDPAGRLVVPFSSRHGVYIIREGGKTRKVLRR